MSYYDFEYVSVAEKKARNQKSLEKLRKRNPDISPIVINHNGRKLARTWWGEAWNSNLESYSDYANRMGRGRSYVRHGAILDLRISAGKVVALVQGRQARPYQVDIDILPLDRGTWQAVTTTCGGKIESLQELVEGRFPKDLAELFTARGQGLFPAPREITLHCSCPDWAVMCKHVAAVLYGVGVRLDENPALFFVLRDVNIDDLVTKVVADRTESLLKRSGQRSARVIDDGDIGAMFGIDIEESGETRPSSSSSPPPPPPPPPPPAAVPSQEKEVRKGFQVWQPRKRKK